MFYDVFCELYAANNLTPSGGAAAIGFNRATVTTWKNTGKAPKGDILLKVAQYFEVPVDFLLQRPPKHEDTNFLLFAMSSQLQ